MKDILWKPKSPEKSQMSQLIQIINESYKEDINSYNKLHQWSVENVSEFWEEVWKYSKIIHSKAFLKVVDDVSKMPGAKWFSGAKLNFAENLLRFRDNRPAIHFKGEGKAVITYSFKEVYDEVEKVTHALRTLGVVKGDRVAGFIPNIPESVIAMLATASIGAIWSSSSPDFGTKAVLDRFAQIEPKVIFAADGYFYNGKGYNSIKKLKEISKNIPALQKVIVVEYLKEEPELLDEVSSIRYKDFINCSPEPLYFEQLPFDHPLYIMYSSGTTGLPKSIVHSAGGTLIQHLKELYFHCDLVREDCIFYFTTCGWMMWNWLVSSLSIGSTIVQFDGSPFYPDGKELWRLSEQLGITVFGTSAKYIESCKESGIRPLEFTKLSKLRLILSTGSPLMDESFDYVYQYIKQDVLLGSISGGTDIISCFALSNPMLPVTRGELQCKGLGMDIHSFNDRGESIINKKGELVCLSAFPSMPVYFWNDKNNQKYCSAYFETFKGVWHHGDFISVSKYGSITIFGRSDATLNPGGVRIGTAEIYKIVGSMDFIDDSLVIGQEWKGNERIILFTKLKKEESLSNKRVQEIRSEIKLNCSPRHVPEKIIQIKEIPYTINGKKVEIAVKRIIQGEDVKNRDALIAPQVLSYYENIPELLD